MNTADWLIHLNRVRTAATHRQQRLEKELEEVKAEIKVYTDMEDALKRG